MILRKTKIFKSWCIFANCWIHVLRHRLLNLSVRSVRAHYSSLLLLMCHNRGTLMVLMRVRSRGVFPIVPDTLRNLRLEE